MTTQRKNWKTYLALGRVSNLPTVWSNVLVGVLLSGTTPPPRAVAMLMAALSLFYVGGMFLNDAFDRHIDARIHPERPIPSGRVSATEVFIIGFGAMGAGAATLATVALASGQSAVPALVSGLLLGALIVVYDLWHKSNPIGPLLMGGCRMLVYVCASLAVTGSVPGPVLGASLVLLSYLVGLTYVAKQETLSEFRNFWPLAFLLVPFVYVPVVGRHAVLASVVLFPSFLTWVVAAVLLLKARAPGNIPRAVVRLIAGISLLDALLLASHVSSAAAAIAVGCFGATMLLQRYVSGT
jgi:4-hydroxybenzoate polyprenyltransferase